jgi:cell division protein ZapE
MPCADGCPRRVDPAATRRIRHCAPVVAGSVDLAMIGHREPPSARYLLGVRSGRWQDDPAQRGALRAFDRVYAEIGTPSSAWHARLRARFVRNPPVGGLYVWGAVGRGKTLLMDTLVEALPVGVAERVHFHRFMLGIHARLRELGDVRDPLRIVAAHIAARARALCLDEFMVTDIGDAMILSGLLDALFARGIALVATSNTPPSALYRGGLQRERFLPAIAAIESHCEVLQLDSPRDWRLRALTRAPVYLTPDDARAEGTLQRLFDGLAQGPVQEAGALSINDRAFAVRRACAQAAWFDFDALCEVASGAADYLELARGYPAILISGLPQFTPHRDDAARRFVGLIDVLYDHRVKLALSAAVPVADLYTGNRLRAEFARAESRLIEMQSRQYLAAPHR